MSSNAELAEKVDAPPAKKESTLRELVELNRKGFDRALAGAIDSDKFIRAALTQIRFNPALEKCSATSVLGALMWSAQLGLEPGGPLAEAHLVPYGNECKLVVGYHGYINVHSEAGVSFDVPQVVYEGDDFHYQLGSDPRIDHVPADMAGGDQGAITHFYAVAHLPSGRAVFYVMPRERMDAVAAKYQGKRDDTPWKADFEEMGKKTVIRRMRKWLPSTARSRALARVDEATVHGVPDSLEDAENPDIIDVEGEEIL